MKPTVHGYWHGGWSKHNLTITRPSLWERFVRWALYDEYWVEFK